MAAHAESLADSRGLVERLGLASSRGWLLATIAALGVPGVLHEALYVALPEELLFRGLVQGELRARLRSRAIVVLVSALAFGVAHLASSSPSAGLLTLAPGLLFALLREASGSVWPAVAAHALANFLWDLGAGATLALGSAGRGI